MRTGYVASPGGLTYYYSEDHEGSITQLTDATGHVIESYRYDAFGAPTTTHSEGSYDNRFLFTGRRMEELGSRDIDGQACEGNRRAERERTSQYIQQFAIYEYRARTSHPGLGRFLSEDPKGFDAGDYNLFRYCKNDPEDLTDPMGLDPVAPETSPIGAAEKDATPEFHASVGKYEKNLRPDADGIPAKDIGAKGTDDTRQAAKDMKENAHPVKKEGTIRMQQEERVYTENSDGRTLHRAGPGVGHRDENGNPRANLPKAPPGTGFPVTVSHAHPPGASHTFDGNDVPTASGQFPALSPRAFISFVGSTSDGAHRVSVYVPTGEGPGEFFHTYDGATFYSGR